MAIFQRDKSCGKRVLWNRWKLAPGILCQWEQGKHRVYPTIWCWLPSSCKGSTRRPQKPHMPLVWGAFWEGVRLLRHSHMWRKRPAVWRLSGPRRRRQCVVLALVRVMVRNPSWLVCSVALGSVPSEAGETTEDSLHLQGLIHPASAQGDDRHGLISGRERKPVLIRGKPSRCFWKHFNLCASLISFPTLHDKVVRKPQAPRSPWRSSGGGERWFFRKPRPSGEQAHTSRLGYFAPGAMRWPRSWDIGGLRWQGWGAASEGGHWEAVLSAVATGQGHCILDIPLRGGIWARRHKGISSVAKKLQDPFSVKVHDWKQKQLTLADCTEGVY